MGYLETIFDAETEFNEGLWLGDELEEALSVIAGFTEKQLTSICYNLFDLSCWSAHGFEFCEVLGLDRLKSF